MPTLRIKAYLALGSAALIWGAAQPLIKPALHYIAPIQYMFLRYLVAFPFALIIFIVLWRKSRPGWKDLFKIISIETSSLINLVILYTGLSYTTALQSALVLNTRPVFITLMGIVLLKEKEELNEWIGLLLSVAGIMFVILGPYLHLNNVSDSGHLLGNCLVIATNVIAAINTFYAKKTYKKISKAFVTMTNVVYGTLFFTIINLIQFGQLPFQALSIPEVILPVIYMAILGTLVAFTLQIYGYNLIEASEATLFQYLEPLVYVPLTIFWLKEPASTFQMIGLAVIISGVVYAARRTPKNRIRLFKHGTPILARIRLLEAPVTTN